MAIYTRIEGKIICDWCLTLVPFQELMAHPDKNYEGELLLAPLQIAFSTAGETHNWIARDGYILCDKCQKIYKRQSSLQRNEDAE